MKGLYMCEIHKIRRNARLAFAVTTRGTPSVDRDRLKESEGFLNPYSSSLISPKHTEKAGERL